MKKRNLLILPFILFLTSCNSNVKEDIKNDNISGLEEYYKIPEEDYYREYESASVSYYEPTEDVHIYNQKEIKLSNEDFNMWKEYVFEYINYGNRKNLKEIGDGASISNRYYVRFEYGEECDIFRFKNDEKTISGSIGNLSYFNMDNNPKVSDELVNKKNELVKKLDEELEKVESKEVEHYC